jgi:hypothetical protein
MSGSRRSASPLWLYERLAAGAVDRDERQHAADDDIAPHAARVEAGVGVYHRLRARTHAGSRSSSCSPRAGDCQPGLLSSAAGLNNHNVAVREVGVQKVVLGGSRHKVARPRRHQEHAASMQKPDSTIVKLSGPSAGATGAERARLAPAPPCWRHP